MGWLHERVVKKGALVVGEWSTEGYDFEASLAVNKDKTFFCGLAIDDEQQFHLTDQRISGWVDLVVGELQQLDAA
jgi:flavodoxin